MRRVKAIFVSAFFLALMVPIGGARRAYADGVSPAAPPSTSGSPTGPAKPASKSAPALAAAPSGSASHQPRNQSAQSGQVQELPPVVVTATRIETPLSQIGTTVTVVNDHSVQVQKIEQVSDALREVPGVQITQAGSPGTTTAVSIRGATDAQTLVLLDGVEVNAGATGAFDLANLTTDNLDQIEVLRGAGGALYGSQAVGGVVNVLSREGEGAPRFTLLSEGGNRATERQVAQFEGAGGKLGYSGALSYFSTTGFRPINDSYDNLYGNLRLDWHATDDTTVRGFARYNRSNVSLVNFSVASGVPIDPNAHQRNEFMLFKGEVVHRFTDQLTARWNGYFVRNELRLNNLTEPDDPNAETDDIPDEIRGTNAEAIYTWKPGFTSLFGFDFKDRWVRSGNNGDFAGFKSITVFRANRQEYAGYIQQAASFFNGHLLGTGGFRVDGNSNFGKEVSPAWSVAVPLDQIGVTLRGNYAEGFRAPSFDELFFPGFGNPNLQPEISSEWDGGITKNLGEIFTFTATYFTRRVHNLIVPVPCPTCLFGSQAGNAGRVDIQGAEFVPEFRMSHFKLGGNFTVLDETHVSASPSIRPIRVPKHAASALAEYSQGGVLLPLDKVNFNVNYIFVGDRDDLDTDGVIRSHVGYHLFNAVASYAPGWRWERIRNEEVFTRVQNLFDRNYSQAFGFKSPPINFVAGVKLDF